MTAPPSSEKGIAIIGIGCRFPGASDWRSFWSNLANGVESITFFDDDTLLKAGVDPALLRDPQYVKAAPVISGFDQFDAGFFEYSPREARVIDPQQRLFLETAWEAFEDAGYWAEKFDGAVGVFAGAGGVVSSYFAANPSLHGSTGGVEHIGNDKDFIATRVSYKLNLTGPSLTVQTACSSSLVAVHLACRSILSGECDMAIAGAASVRVPHHSGYLSRQGDIQSPDGHCRAFDAAAQGTVFGSGVGAVLLKHAADALADGDHIYAVIRGSAVNNDGAAKVSYTASSVSGQAKAMLEAFDRAGVAPGAIDYVEAHGTGTVVGDPLEIEALTRVFRTDTRQTGFCGIGSVKTNIGHLEQTAGVASLIKVALALHHRKIPPSLNFETPNPKIAFAQTPFFVNTALRDWPAKGARKLAAVNALGLGGTNAFAVLEEAPSAAPRAAREVDRPLHVLPLSARSEPALRQQIERWRRHLGSSEDAGDAGDDLADQCFTAATGRVPLDWRYMAVGSNRGDMLEQLSHIAPQSISSRKGKRPLAFLFTGQGSQYPGMAAELFRTQPVFRAALERCDLLASPHLGESLLKIIFDEDGKRIHQTACTQPALFAVEWALAELWRSWGVVPDAVMGHSVGEYVAACVAGVYSLEDAIALIAARGRLMQALPAGGAMAALFADGPAVEALLGRKIGAKLSIAAYNSPENTVISGAATAVAAALELAARAGIEARPLTVSHAFHSPLLKPMAGELETLAARHSAHAPKIALIDNLSGKQSRAARTPGYWSAHSLEPVRFVEGLQTLAAMGIVDFVEIGPGSTLASLAQQTLRDPANGERRFLSSIAKDREWGQLAQTLGALWRGGVAVDWRGFDAPFERRRMSGPTYAFERERYWIEPAHRSASAAQDDLLGARLKSPLAAWQFETVYDLDHLPWLTDHRIFGHAVLPLTAGLVVLAQAGQQRLADAAVAVSALTYREALVVPEGGSRVVQVLIAEDGEGFEAQLTSLAAANTGEWQHHIAARIERLGQPALAALKTAAAAALDVDGLQAVLPAHYYEAIQALGFGYGPGFRGIVELWRGDGVAVTRVELPVHLSGSAHALHPALLDACLHSYPAVLPAYRDLSNPVAGPEGTYLPISIERFEIYRPGADRVWVACGLRDEAAPEQAGHTVDIRIFTEDGSAVALIAGLNVKRLSARVIAPAQGSSILQSLYAVQWILKPALPEPGAGARDGWLVLGDKGGLGEVLAQRLGEHGLSAKLQDPRRWKKPADPTEALRKAAKQAGDLNGIVLIHALDVQTSETMTGEAMAAAEAHCCHTALQLLKAVAAWGEAAERLPRVWIVTRASQAPASEVPGGDPLHASLWGLGRVAALEHPELWGGLVDLGDDGDVDGLVGELLASDGEAEVALRAGHRYAPRLMPEASKPSAGGTSPAFDPGSTYLISGGLGALGLIVSRWLVERHGVRHLVLTARRPPNEAAAAALALLERQGARIVVKAADIGRADDVDGLFADIAAELPPLKGVFHVAGLLDDGVMLQMAWDKYVRVTQPKVLGGWLLHRATRELALDHFVLFSSVLSVVGSMGQVNYVAGNAFLDGLAEYRRRAGLPAQVINWGPWAETGLATESGKRGESIWRARGTQYIAVDDGVEAMQAIVAGRLPQTVVSITDWSRWAEQYSQPPLFLEALARETSSARAAPTAQRGDTLARLAAVPDDGRKAILVDVISELTRSVLEIKGAIDPNQPLREMGLDSLIAITLINQLDAALGVRVPAATMLKGPSIAQLADDIVPKIDIGATPVPAPDTVVIQQFDVGAAEGRWLVEIQRNPNARYRLICFPFAGGGSAIYRAWADGADPDAEILAIEPPGRLSRVQESPLTRIEDFVDALLPELKALPERPLAMFGHCIGGLTMYEVARALVEREGVVPLHLFASGSRPPHRLIGDSAFEKQLISSLLALPEFSPLLPSHRQPDAVLAEILRHFQIDATQEMLSIPELRELVLPVVRAEFEMASRYVFKPAQAWQVPITTFRGEADLYVTHDDASAWADLTDGSFKLLTRDGAHFGVVEDRPFIQGVIAQALAD